MKRRSTTIPAWWLYIVFAVFILAVLIFTTRRAFRETPSRDVNLQLPGQGWVTFTLTTDPFPPLPTGLVVLTLEASKSTGISVDLGERIPYSFGVLGNEDILDNGVLTRSGAVYWVDVLFPTPGDYWMRFDLGSGNVVEYQIYVEPAQ